MKILIVKTFPVPININNITYNHQELGQAAALRRSGHICDVMCVSNDNKFHQRKIEVNGQPVTLYYVKSFKILKNGFFRNVDAILSQYDILQVSEYNQIYTWHLAKKYHEKVVVYHGPYFSPFNKRYNLMAKFFDLFFIGRYKKLNTYFITKSKLAASYLTNKGLVNVFPVGVGLEETFMHDVTSGDETVFIAKIKETQGLKLLYVGAIEPRRNSLFLLDILYSLRQKGENISLVLVGKTKSQQYAKAFWTKVQKLGLSNQIIYKESIQQKQIASIYNNSDIFLFPTHYDIFGMVLLEAMFFKKTVLSTVNGGSDMLIHNGDNGYIIDNLNVDDWANKILSIFENKAELERIGNNANKTITDFFTWDKLVKKFVSIYKTKLGC